MIVVVTFALNSAFNFAVGLLVAKFLGPAEFGRFALALAVATFINTAVFDWIRLAATRFYGEGARNTRPEVRATLDCAFAILATGLGVVALAVILSGVEFQLSPGLVGLAVAAGIANALYDYHTALVRARFLDRTYGRVVMTKNVLALALTVAGAWWFGSAKFALIGWCLSVACALGGASAAFRDPGVTPRLASRRLMGDYARYGVPVITALVLYQLIALANRSLVTSRYGFAETGQFSLAYDIGLRIVAAIGSTLDVLLFQIAVRYDETHGVERARLQVAHNMSVVVAVVVPACVGCWLVLPSFEALVVPAEFRGPFARDLALLLPGLCAAALVQYGINPMFQIVKRTLPLIAAAVVACLAFGVLALLLPDSGDASSLAIAQAGGFMAGLVALLIIAAVSDPVWPRLRDLVVVFASAATMFGLLLPLRAREPSVTTLTLQIAIGIAVSVAFVAVFDLAGLRAMAFGWLRGRRSRAGSGTAVPRAEALVPTVEGPLESELPERGSRFPVA